MDPYDDEPDIDAPDDGFDPDEMPDLDALADAADDVTHPRPFTPRADNPQYDDDGRIDADLPCLRCEYNLRGQLPEGTCPECGAPVAESMRTDRLSQAHPAWLRKLRRSMSWLMLGGGAVILASCVNGGMATSTFVDATARSVLDITISLGQAVLFCIGYWLLTEPEPGVLRPRVSRPLTRWTIVPGYALSVPAGLLEMAHIPTLLIASGVGQIIAGVAVIVGFCSSLVYLRHLARRIPNKGLARQCTIVFWGWIGSVSALVVGALAVVLVAMNTPAMSLQGLSTAMLFFCPAMIALITFFIWWLVLISAFSRSFDRAVKASRNRVRAAHRGA